MHMHSPDPLNLAFKYLIHGRNQRPLNIFTFWCRPLLFVYGEYHLFVYEVNPCMLYVILVCNQQMASRVWSNNSTATANKRQNIQFVRFTYENQRQKGKTTSFLETK